MRKVGKLLNSLVFMPELPLSERDVCSQRINPASLNANAVSLKRCLGEAGVAGRIYEYFLGKFASAEGKLRGEFYTPSA